jgi:hypothetical protein
MQKFGGSQPYQSTTHVSFHIGTTEQAQGLSGRLYFEDMKLYISTRCRIPDCWGFELGFGCPVIEHVQPLDNPRSVTGPLEMIHMVLRTDSSPVICPDYLGDSFVEFLAAITKHGICQDLIKPSRSPEPDPARFPSRHLRHP